MCRMRTVKLARQRGCAHADAFASLVRLPASVILQLQRISSGGRPGEECLRAARQLLLQWRYRQLRLQHRMPAQLQVVDLYLQAALSSDLLL